MRFLGRTWLSVGVSIHTNSAAQPTLKVGFFPEILIGWEFLWGIWWTESLWLSLALGCSRASLDFHSGIVHLVSACQESGSLRSGVVVTKPDFFWKSIHLQFRNYSYFILAKFNLAPQGGCNKFQGSL